LERFYDLLFEISNDYRHRVLLLLKEKPMRITDLSRQLRLTTQEISRHVSRLGEVGLTYKDVDRFYHLSPYGKSILIILEEFLFLSNNSDYFVMHSIDHLERKFVKRIGELSGSAYTDNVMSFLHFVENVIDEAEVYVWLQVDQFPLTVLGSILEALKRGVQFKIIENEDMESGPRINLESMEGIQALARTRSTPLTEQRMIDDTDFFMFLSEDRCAIAFPMSEGKFDYRGFTARDERSLRWCRDLFQHNWDRSEPSLPPAPTQQVIVQQRQLLEGARHRKIVVEGHDDSSSDAIAVQNAVDNYEEVILKGTFNFGTSTVYIRRSVVLKGEGRENGIPTTKVYKKGWTFPFFIQEYLIVVSGENIDVTIENIHFTDFNYNCIWNRQGNSVRIRDNRICLDTGLGRGMRLGNIGDHVVGITSGGTRELGGFPGGVVIEGNYLDFAISYGVGGYRSRKGLETDPAYRPDLGKHDSYCGVGIVLNRNLGEVIVRDNVIRNMNSRGIVIQDNWESADICVVGNTIISEVYGSYPFSTHFAGIGIHVQSAWADPRSGVSIDISNNEIKCYKLNYCGIAVYGPSMYQEGAGKIGECIIQDNNIHVWDGSVGVLIRKNDRTEIINNKISGKAYYGFYLWGSRDREGFDLGSNKNFVADNDMTDLVIKSPDEYSDSHIDGRMFTGYEGKSATAHVWVNAFSKDNVIKVKADETVIDEGESNSIIYDNQEA